MEITAIELAQEMKKLDQGRTLRLLLSLRYE
jgi:hypothetical protein